VGGVRCVTPAGVGFGIYFEGLASGSPDGGGSFEAVLVREYKCRPREVQTRGGVCAGLAVSEG
jgi:hypothetical protein